MSIFQGGPSIHINTSAQDRLEEEEQRQDEQRRKKELEQNLDNAFDDLYDEDEDDASSVNDSSNFTSMNMTRSRRANKSTNGTNRSTTRNPPPYSDKMNHIPGDLHRGPYTPGLQPEGLQTELLNGYHLRYLQERAGRQDQANGNGEDERQRGYGDVYQRGGCRDYDDAQTGSDDFQAHLQDMRNMEQLKMLYEMQVKESRQLAEQLAASQHAADLESESLRSRLTIAHDETKRAEMSLQQSQQLLATQQHRVRELEQQLLEQQKRCTDHDQRTQQLAAELQATGVALQDAQHQLQVTRRNLDVKSNADALFREQQARHREEVTRLEEDLEKARSRWTEKDNELKQMERRCADMERAREDILVEKGGVINRLAAELEAAQARLAGGDTVKLKEKLAMANLDRNTAKQQSKELAMKLEQTAEELVRIRSEYKSSQQLVLNLEASLEEIARQVDNFAGVYFGRGYAVPSSPVGKVELILKELEKSKSEQSAHVQQLRMIGEDLATKEEVISSYHTEKQSLLARIDELESNEIKLRSELKIVASQAELACSSADNDLLQCLKERVGDLERQVEEGRKELKSTELKYAELEMQHEQLKQSASRRKSLEREANSDLLQEVEKMATELKHARQESAELKSLYIEVCTAKGDLMRELKEWEDKQLEAELAKERLRVSEISEQLEREQAKVDKLNRKILDQQKDFADKLNQHIEAALSTTKLEESKASLERLAALEVQSRSAARVSQQDAELRRQLVVLEERLAERERVIDEMEKRTTLPEKDKLLQELMSKAEQFNAYIIEKYQRECSMRHVSTNTIQISSNHVHTNTESLEATDMKTASDVVSAESLKDTGHPNDQKVGTRESVKKVVDLRSFAVQTDEEEIGDADDEYDVEQHKLTFDMAKKEQQIRQEIAEKFAVELKNLDMKYGAEIAEMRLKHTANIEQLKDLLETKASEVETLTKIVITQRTKVTEILELREKEIASVIQESGTLKEEHKMLKEKLILYGELKQQLEKCQSKVLKMKRELERRNEEAKEEREKTAAVLKEYGQKLKNRESRLAHSEGQLEQLREKYKSVKKTALNYKEYATEKDRHVDSELDRIRNHYETAMSRLQARLDTVIANREQQVNHQINKMESEFEARLNDVR